MAKRATKGVIEELYAFWQSHIVGYDEAAFYRQAIQEAQGSCLEVGCGSGRLLVRFLQEGHPIEGVDASRALLDMVRSKAAMLKKEVVLYQQKMDEVEIPGKLYRLVYIPLGSFQLMENVTDAKRALRQYYSLLDEGGKLIIALFIPWKSGLIESPNWRIVSDINDRKHKRRFVTRERCSIDAIEQKVEAEVRYETWMGKDLLEFSQRTMNLNWYGKEEFTFLLSQAGFQSVEAFRSYGPFAPVRPDFMLFVATR